MSLIYDYAGFTVKLTSRTLAIIDRSGTASVQAMVGAARHANAGEPVQQYGYMPASGDLTTWQVRLFHRLNMFD